MAQNADKIIAGPCRIFYGVTAGASGTPPTLITHTDGVPSTGTEVGFTEGDTSISYKLSKEEIDAEQTLAGVDCFVTSEEAMVTFTAKEHTVETLKRAMDGIGFDSTGARDLFYFGSGAGAIATRKECIVVTARQRIATTKFVIFVLYRAYSPDGFKVAFGKKSQAIYQITFKGLADVTRNIGDQMGYYAIEK